MKRSDKIPTAYLLHFYLLIFNEHVQYITPEEKFKNAIYSAIHKRATPHQHNIHIYITRSHGTNIPSALQFEVSEIPPCECSAVVLVNARPILCRRNLCFARRVGTMRSFIRAGFAFLRRWTEKLVTVKRAKYHI